MRNAAQMKLEMNEPLPPTDFYVNADSLNLGWLKLPESLPSVISVSNDFCYLKRSEGTQPGAFSDKSSCQQLN